MEVTCLRCRSRPLRQTTASQIGHLGTLKGWTWPMCEAAWRFTPRHLIPRVQIYRVMLASSLTLKGTQASSRGGGVPCCCRPPAVGQACLWFYVIRSKVCGFALWKPPKRPQIPQKDLQWWVCLHPRCRHLNQHRVTSPAACLTRASCLGFAFSFAFLFSSS